MSISFLSLGNNVDVGDPVSYIEFDGDSDSLNENNQSEITPSNSTTLSLFSSTKALIIGGLIIHIGIYLAYRQYKHVLLKDDFNAVNQINNKDKTGSSFIQSNIILPLRKTTHTDRLLCA
ncbi:unnamed protein product [Adineta steineri]|uniref:Uncharacterized protein n=1 Tax=Adineta steineri TaxID=433720 RepID=A0A819T8K0_9BILA|nr:unnamed protein product [Adineta steineri]CAF4077539.1 unnamed protein product [Adineta steineri]